VNLPNQLTLARFALTLLFMAVLLSGMPYASSLALALFVVAGITDWMDGSIARRRNLVTNFGILMDPLADKILVCSAFIVFVEFRWIASWMVVIIVARELAITGLRLLAASKNVVLAAEGFGKHKTISQMTTIMAMLVLESYESWGMVGKVFGWHLFGQPWVNGFTVISQWVAMGLTLLSGALYLSRNRKIYLPDM